MPQPKHKWSIKNTPPRPNTQSRFYHPCLDVLDQLIQKRNLRDDFIDPELMQLCDPQEVFTDLEKAATLCQFGIMSGYKIGISGDYDVDGMTSTALLLRTFKELNATATYAIPSRTGEGYGLNNRIVEEFYNEGYKILITVDNGTSAIEPIKRAKELGLIVIITDHHEPSLTGELPIADAILNPKFVPQDNEWSQVSGVGMAFILAMSVLERFSLHEKLMGECLELLTLGTIADMVALTGVNRRWVKRGLKLIPNSQNLGIQALMAVAGMELGGKDGLKPDDIGFKLAPRINSVGRIGEPQQVINLLSSTNVVEAMELAHEIEALNEERQGLVKTWEQIVFDHINLQLEADPEKFEREKVIYYFEKGIHKGIVGLIANKVVEKYGYPAFVGSVSEEYKISGSCRGGMFFDVFAALNYCSEYLATFGGHKAAGGFSLWWDVNNNFHERLIKYANLVSKSEELGTKLVFVDHHLDFTQISLSTFQEVQVLQPFGMKNPEPIFYTTKVKVLKQDKLNFPGAVKFTFEQAGISVKAIGWDFQKYLPLPSEVDIAYKLKENLWNGKITIELNLESFKLC
jgi:single-stranded-DNA-specific exonuclease